MLAVIFCGPDCRKLDLFFLKSVCLCFALICQYNNTFVLFSDQTPVVTSLQQVATELCAFHRVEAKALNSKSRQRQSQTSTLYTLRSSLFSASFFIFLCSSSFVDLCEEALSVIVVRHRATPLKPKRAECSVTSQNHSPRFLFFGIQVSAHCFSGDKVFSEITLEQKYCRRLRRPSSVNRFISKIQFLRPE